jgi:DNA polymerase-4
MHRLGIRTGADLKDWTEEALVEAFGKVGRFYYRIARGQDDRPVNPNRIRKSVGVETSFFEDLVDRPAILAALESLAQQLQSRLDDKQLRGRTLTLKVKYADYQQVTRSRTVATPLTDREAILGLALELLTLTAAGQKEVRLLGLSVANLAGGRDRPPASPKPTETYIQLTLNF